MLAFLFLAVIVAVAVVAGIAALPGWIARRQKHEQTAAINVCGWFGLPTGILWVVAMVWAYFDRTAGSAPDSTVALSSGNMNQLRTQIERLETTVNTLQGARK